MAGLQIDTDALAAIAHAEKNLAQDKSHSDYSHDQKYDPEAPVQDGIHDGLEFPTDEERITLRRVTDTIPWNSFLIAFIELVERFSYYGTTVVFTNYIQQPLPDGSRTGAGGRNGQSGALGKGQRASTGLTTFNQFWVYFIPLFGAYVADTYWGRYKTVCVSVGIALFGHVLLIISSVPGVIEHPDGSLACFIVALIIMGLGTGGFKPNTSPLVAEQYKKTRLFIRYTKSGEKVIVDPSLTTSSIYMYFYLFINIGALVGQIGMTYSEKYVGFWLAYMLPTALFLLCPIVLFYGRNRYICSPPTGSVLGRAIRVCNFAARGRWSWNPIKCYTQMKAPGFWDAAKPSMLAPGDRPAWMTYNDVWVDELRRGLAACKVFVWFPIYWLTYNQINNNLTSQAATMVTNGVPNDVLSNLDPLALIIFIPICDLFLYPGLRRLGFNFTPIKKMTLGFYTGAAAMAWAAVLQHYIYITNPCGYYVSTCSETSNLNVWIQTGSYVLIAFSEILASITSLEYAFTKAPKNMRSLVMSVCLFTTAVSATIGEAFVSLSSDPLLVWNYGSMGVLSFVAGVLFWFTFKDLDAMEDQLNQIPAGGF